MILKPWAVLCIGILIGVSLSLCGFGFISIGRGFASWGALQYETDTTIRSHVKAAGILLPPDAHDIHYAVSGFVDHSLWIKFTVPKEKICDVVRDSLSKSESDFAHSSPKHLLNEIRQNPNQNHDLSWWTPASVTSPRSWSNPEEKEGQHLFEDWLIDMETGTFYITRWDT